jgi:phosphoglycolate phosphatase-like HAD superfamily hydrolase
MAPSAAAMTLGAGQARALLSAADLVFWDFDGVIKDSVAVKSVGFEQLFLPHGAEVAARVRQHHEAHGGVSRFDKMPIYLGWAGETVSPARVAEFCDRFAALVRQAVVDSPWVPGVREYLEANHSRQVFVLVTATPQAEIEEILQALKLARCFRAVAGAPTPKAAALGCWLPKFGCPPGRALMVGDSDTDWRAAQANEIPFLLRRTAENRALQTRYEGPAFEGLSNE